MNEKVLWGETLNALLPLNGWLTPSGNPEPTYVAAYYLEVESTAPGTHHIFVHAEERYELFFNGELLGRGSERGDMTHQFCEEYTLRFINGMNRLVIRTWSLGKIAPFAQMTGVNGGLVLFSDNEATQKIIGTGIAPWHVTILPGYSFYVDHPTGHMIGPSFKIDGREFDHQWLSRAVDGMTMAEENCLPAGMSLYRAALPLQHNSRCGNGIVRHVDAHPGNPVCSEADIDGEAAEWNGLLMHDKALIIAANTVRRVIIDLDDYCCVYASLQLSGGRDAQIRWAWAEALFQGKDWYGAKGNRDEIEGKYFWGHGDIYISGGTEKQEFSPLWWRSCRYMELQITTAAAPVVLERVRLESTGYPLFEEANFRCADEELNLVKPVLIHTLRLCSHETYMDCPYYEQLMYVGDTRLEVLVNYVLTRDHRLARKSVNLYYNSFLRAGLTQSRYPNTHLQIIPPFSLWWIAMVHDYAMWHEEPELVRLMLPRIRKVLSVFAATACQGSALATGPVGWNFYDWVPGWEGGVPPSQKSWSGENMPDIDDCALPPERGVVPGGIMNQHYAMVLRMASELESYAGSADNAADFAAQAQRVANELKERFFHEDKKLFADDLEGKYFSEHSQVLALLSGTLPEEQASQIVDALLHQPDLSRTTVYFSYYLLDVIWRYSDYSELRSRLELWTGLKSHGFRTTPEAPEPSRSDCHAWGSHPYYHFMASLAGIRPDGFGGKRFRILPITGGPDCSGSLPLRQGDLKFALKHEGAQLQAEIEIPAGIEAVLEWQGRVQVLRNGMNHFSV